MKKILLSIAVLGIIGTANAQKLALVEEFSGENCPPCAAQNPGFMALLETPSNASKVLLLKYQSPIPSAGPIYYENTVFTDARMDYYQVGFAPYARINGDHEVGENNPQAIQYDQVGMIAHAQQSDIDNAAAESTNFTMSISEPVYSGNGQSFTTTITVTATAATTESNTKLRVALAEELQYATAPGTNGETHFQNVVRQMYPNADGQAIDASWTAGQTRTYTITGAVPSYVNDNPPSVFLAAFLQDDTTKEVLQATRTDGNMDIEKANLDVAVSNLQVEADNLMCDLPISFDDSTINVTNTATTAITSFDILYKFSNEEDWNTESWTGNLATGNSIEVTLPTLTLNGSGVVRLEVKVDNLNGVVDYNDYDNTVSRSLAVANPEAADLPLTNDLEAPLEDWISYTASSNGYPIVKISSDGLGYDGSDFLLWYPCYQLPNGVAPGYYITPKANLTEESALDFYVAYAQYQSGTTTLGDRLEIVYSTDCGSTWTRIWMQENSDLATAPNTANNFFPTANQWEMRSVDLSEVPEDALIAFRATTGYGNNIFIDNITIRTGAVSIDKIMDLSGLNLFPNPTTEILNVSLTMKMSESVNFTVINSIGQEVMNVTETLSEGNQQTTLNVSNLAAGVYILNINTEGGSTQRKFVKN